jgi:hypothetical protein
VIRKEFTMGSKKSKQQIATEAEAFADAVVDFGVGVFQRKERDRQYAEEVTYAHKREIASEPKDPDGRTWTDREFSNVYNHGDKAANLAHLRLIALRSAEDRLGFVERLVANALDEMPTPASKREAGAVAQLNGALAILRQESPSYVSDVRVRSQSGLCAICNCLPCRERMEHHAKYKDTFGADQPEAPQCCRHESATLFLPF